MKSDISNISYLILLTIQWTLTKNTYLTFFVVLIFTKTFFISRIVFLWGSCTFLLTLSDPAVKYHSMPWNQTSGQAVKLSAWWAKLSTFHNLIFAVWVSFNINLINCEKGLYVTSGHILRPQIKRKGKGYLFYFNGYILDGWWPSFEWLVTILWRVGDHPGMVVDHPWHFNWS